MFVRKFLLPLLFLSSIPVWGAGKPSTFRTDVRTDGQNLEWTSPLPRFDKKTGINYDVANDDRRLYFILRIADEKVQQQILKNGLEIWIDKEGRKDRITGVTFPLPLSERVKAGKKPGQLGTGGEGAFSPVGQNKPGNGEQSAKKIALQIMPDMVEKLKLSGFFIDNGVQPAATCPVKAFLTIDASGCLIYELEVPFNTFFTEKLDAETTPVAFGLTFLIKGDELSDEGFTPPMGMMAGMMGGPGGPPPGMMPFGTSSDDNTLLEKKIWFRINLALHP